MGACVVLAVSADMVWIFSRSMCTSGSLKGCCSWVAKERQWLSLEDRQWGMVFIPPPLMEGYWKLSVSLAGEVLWCTVKVDLFIDLSDLLCSGGGKEYQRKSSSILFINFISLTWMSLGMCSMLLDYAVRILFWLPKREQCGTHHHSVCVICSWFCALCGQKEGSGIK